MVSLNGYYDGNTVQTLEKIHAKKNQKVIITILDEFIEESSSKIRTTESARGSLAKYANPKLWDKEETAWEEEAGEKYGNARY